MAADRTLGADGEIDDGMQHGKMSIHGCLGCSLSFYSFTCRIPQSASTVPSVFGRNSAHQGRAKTDVGFS